MTLLEALTDVYGSTDNQDQYDPMTTNGRATLVALLKRAAKAVAVWRTPDGRRLRFRVMEDEDIIELAPITGVIDAHASGKTLTVDLATAAHSLKGWTLVVTLPVAGEFITTVIAQAGASLRLLDDPGEPMALLDATFTRARFDFGTSLDAVATASPVVEIVALYDLATGSEYATARSSERFQTGRATVGVPSSFSRFAGGFVLDTCPAESTPLRLRYVRWPAVGALDDDPVCDLPDVFHDVVVEWVRHFIFDSGGDFQAARSSWAYFEGMLAALRDQDDLATDWLEYRART